MHPTYPTAIIAGIALGFAFGWLAWGAVEVLRVELVLKGLGI